VFTRLYWLIVGTILGFAAALWGMVRVRQAAARFTPAGVQSEVVGAVRQLGADLRDAASEGRVGMRETEARLRGQLAGERAGGRSRRR
jgi:hypothetical protein